MDVGKRISTSYSHAMMNVRVKIGTDGMNKLERAYSQNLEGLRLAGEIQVWQFEPLKLRLPGQASYYTPDFLVVEAEGEMVFHEVKGFWRDDARVKIKAAAGIYRWARFVAVQRVRKTWTFEEIKPGKVCS